MTEEMWKDIPDYEGLYQASNLGRIKSLLNNKHIILQPHHGSAGRHYNYLQVKLYKNGILSNHSIHRVIAKTFIDNYSEDLQVDHINNNPSDNRLCNLRMVTPKENMNNPNSNTIKPCKIYFNNGEIKEFRSLSDADEYIGAPSSTIAYYIAKSIRSKKYGFKKAEYM